ncbi:NAD(P)-dependent oxidoreductase [Candidatus Sumerlaeota bacterium]|nr:NAD(P)-dependent oxidoreductase [Candidatus Sumerlaeota bacterium]
MTQQRVGLIGLGLMGSAIAERLIAAKWVVLGYDIDRSRCEALRHGGGDVAADPAQVASDCDRIILSLPTTDIVEAVVGQMEAHLRSGQIIIDTTTGDPARTAALGARLAARGVGYLDATISGSSAQTRRGDVIVMAGGRREIFAACEDIFRCFARRWFHVGEWGSGAQMKLVSNLVLGLNRAALAEGLTFAKALELDLEATLAILMESAAYSRVMDTKGRKMIAGDFAVQAKLSQHLKDVRLILAAAQAAGLELPLSAEHHQLLEAAEVAGFGEADNSAIVQAFTLKK